MREGCGKPDIGAISGDEGERNFQRVQPLGDRKTFLPDEPDIEQRKIRGAVGDHLKCTGDVSRGPGHFHSETKNPVFEVERNDRVVLDDQDIVGYAIGGNVHHLASKSSRIKHCTNSDRPRRPRITNPAAGSPDETITSPRRLSVHLCTQQSDVSGYRDDRETREHGMIVQTKAPNGIERPDNNLLRRLNAGDFALIAPHLVPDEAEANELLYNPGDDVDTVHFPCGPSLASYLVANEDGRDVETILVGREGAVGGIVSLGYLPAFTRITVKFGGPFARLPVGKLDAAKTTSVSLRNVFARYADCLLAQMFQSTACNAIHSIEQRTAKWIIAAIERTNGDNIVPLTHEQLATLLGVGRSYVSRVIQTFKAEGVLETRRGSILVRNSEALQMRACLCNETVKNHFEEVLRGVYPTEATGK